MIRIYVYKKRREFENIRFIVKRIKKEHEIQEMDDYKNKGMKEWENTIIWDNEKTRIREYEIQKKRA